VGVNFPQLVSFDQALFVNAQSTVAFFQQRVQPVQDGGVTEVGVLEHDPLSLLDGADKNGVHPLETALPGLGSGLAGVVASLPALLLAHVESVASPDKGGENFSALLFTADTREKVLQPDVLGYVVAPEEFISKLLR